MRHLTDTLFDCILDVIGNIEQDNMRFLRVHFAIDPAQLEKVGVIARGRVVETGCEQVASIEVFHLGLMAQQDLPAIDADPHLL